MPIDKESLKARLMKRYSEQLDEMFDQLSEDEPLGRLPKQGWSVQEQP